MLPNVVVPDLTAVLPFVPLTAPLIVLAPVKFKALVLVMPLVNLVFSTFKVPEFVTAEPLKFFISDTSLIVKILSVFIIPPRLPPLIIPVPLPSIVKSAPTVPTFVVSLLRLVYVSIPFAISSSPENEYPASLSLTAITRLSIPCLLKSILPSS